MDPSIVSALAAAIDGRATLFLGAGFSVGATSAKNETLPTGSELAEHLCTHIAPLRGLSLRDAADEFAEQYGRQALAKILKEMFTNCQSTATHANILTHPWRRIYTTNYDDVAEHALVTLGKPHKTFTLDQNPRSIGDHPNATHVVHINGYARQITDTTFPDTINISESDNLIDTFVSSRWKRRLQWDIDNSHAVFFVGYSMNDLDITRVVAQSESTRSKIFFVTRTDPELIEQRRLSRLGTVLPIGAAMFCKLFKDIPHSRSPQHRGLLHFSIGKAPRDGSGELTDKEATDFLIFGATPEPLHCPSEHSEDIPVPIFRDAANAVVSAVLSHKRVIAVHSALGNGKTVFLQIVKAALLRIGKNVFTLTSSGPGLPAELDAITKTPGDKAVIVDQYDSHVQHILPAADTASIDTTFIIAARSTAHEVNLRKLRVAFGAHQVMSFCLDKLTEKESLAISSSFDAYGLWGSSAGLAIGEKLRIISKDCRGALGALLLKAYEAPVISQKFQELFGELNSSPVFVKAIAGVLYLQVIGISVVEHELYDLIGESCVNDARFRSNKATLEVFNLDGGFVKARSPVLAGHLLRNILRAEWVEDGIAALIQRVEKNQYSPDLGCGVSYRRLFHQLMRYGNLQRAFSATGKSSSIYAIYERIGKDKKIQGNPQYWLQYAAARLTAGDIPLGGTYLSTAYAKAKKIRGYDTFQIDNHQARYHMLVALERGLASEAAKDVGDAASIIRRQMAKEGDRRFPFRVASLVGSVVDRWGAAWNARELRSIRAFVGDVVGAIRRFTVDGGSDGRVDAYEELLTQSADRLDELLEKTTSQQGGSA